MMIFKITIISKNQYIAKQQSRMFCVGFFAIVVVNKIIYYAKIEINFNNIALLDNYPNSYTEF
jgi:hypothetical protein